jgi:hypothetical protein
MDIQTYTATLDKLKGYRGTLDNYWQEVADYEFPYRDFNTSRQAGDKRNVDLYDTTALYALKQLASGLHGRLTPPSSRWFGVGSDVQDLDDAGRGWLQTATEFAYNVFRNPDTRFASQTHEFYLDLCAFGNAVMLPTWDKKRGFRFRTRKLANCYISEDDSGTIDTLYFVDEIAADDLYKEYGDSVSPKIMELIRKPATAKTKIKFLHVVEPRIGNYGTKAIDTKKPFKSIHIDLTNQHIIKESGFDIFPYIFARFYKRSGEFYGYGPAMEALPEAKMLNRMMETMIRTIEKMADPVTLMPYEAAMSPYRLDAGAINYYDPDVGPPTAFPNNARPDFLDATIKSKQEQVKSMFYVDWMNLPNQPNMTATEILSRQQDSLRLLSPMLSRIESEFLSPLINLIILIGIQNDLLPAIPESLAGAETRIEYLSPIAVAQRQEDVNRIIQSVSIGAQFAQFDPNVMKIFKAEDILRSISLDTYNIPVRFIKTDEEMRIEEQNQQPSPEQIETLSKAGKNIAGAAGELGFAVQ